MGKKAIVANGRVVSTGKITEADLMTVETARSRVVAARQALTKFEAACAEAEAEIVARLEAGCKIDPHSSLSAGITEENGPRRPEWKELYLGHMESHHGVVRSVEEAMILSETAGMPKQVLRIFHTAKGRLQ